MKAPGSRRAALAAALLLAGCGGEPARADGAPGSEAQERAAATSADGLAAYERCLDSADGAAAASACADTAIASATSGRGALAAFLRELGDRQLADDPSLAQRVVVADAAARFALGLAGSEAVPAAAAPALPPALAARWASVRAAHCAAAGPDCAARANALLGQYLAATADTTGTTAADTGATAMPTGPLPDCAALLAERGDPEALLGQLERTYPAAYADPSRVDAAVAADSVPLLARSLACLGGLTGYDAFVADQAVALFASRRHGAAAFAALDRMAAGGGPQAAYAREFAAQMRDYIGAAPDR